MSVRRLADDAVQPQEFAFSRANAAWAKKKLKNYPKGRQASAVIPLLMRAQEQEGWVTKPAIEHIADMLDMPLIRVLEVATFYTQFQLAPVGSNAHIQVCGTTPCMLRGSDELIAVCKRRIAQNQFELSSDGKLSWEEVECQGACVNAPMVMVFKDTYEDLTAERLEEIIDAFEAGKGDSVAAGPQIDRIFSAPEGGLTSLNDNPEKKAVHKTAGAKANKQSSSGAKKAAKAAPAKQSKPKASSAALSDANRPAGIDKPANVDNLKLISGVGPKIEQTLNDLGIYTFAQVAKWKKAERAWVDGYLRFHGRIERDDWVKQAKALAKGGRDEYIRVFGKEPR